MIDKIDAWQVFWSILIVLTSYIAIMITMFRNELKEIRNKIELKVDWLDCKEIRIKCEADCTKSRAERDKAHHFHGKEGRAGEVVIK